MHKNKSGFTIVEVAIVIAVIAILLTIGSLSFIMIQRQARDAQRESNAIQITEALEKYYDENGEYPGCSAITTSANDVRSYTLKSINPSVLQAPKDETATGNSIVCQSLDNIPDNQDKYAYSGDESAACLTGPVCAKWSFSWRKETGGTGNIESRREAEAVAVVPAITADSAGITQIDVSWTAATQAISYELQRSSTPGFETPQVSTHTTTESLVNGLLPNTTYYFRVRSVLPNSSSAWSTVASATTSDIQTPSGTPTVTAAMSGTNARGTAAGGSCATGTTIERQIRYNTNDGSWSGWTTGTPRDVAATEGYTYTFQSQARCVVGSVASSWVQSTNTASVTRPVTAPSGLTISAAMSGTNARGTAGGGTCASGTTIERQIRYQSTNTSTAGTWSSWTTGTPRDVAASQGYRYTFQQQARCVGQNASSAWVTSGTANTVRPIAAPSTPTISASTSGDTTTYSRNNISCPTGTTTRYQYKYLADYSGGYETAWYGPTTGVATIDWNTQSQGYQYRVQMQAQCYTVHATSGWSGTGTGSYIRPVNPPGPISYTGQRINNRTIHIRGISSCGPGASLYSRADFWSGNWSFIPRPPDKYGWYRTHFGSWSQSWDYYGTSVLTGTVSTIDIPASRSFAGSFEMRCVNHVTGRQSATNGYQQSPTYTL